MTGTGVPPIEEASADDDRVFPAEDAWPDRGTCRVDPDRPPHGADEVRRLYKHLNNGLREWDDLDYRELGILLYHRPRLFHEYVEGSA